MQVDANGITLEVEETGAPGGPPVLLISGQSEQLIDWPDGLIQVLVDSGYRVITFDNRDVGFSARCPDPYTLDDMAADTLGVLDALGVKRAHLIGSSLGGVIAQIVCLQHPERVAALVLLMTASHLSNLEVDDELALSQCDAEVFAADRRAYNERFGGSVYRKTRDEVTAQALRHHRRSFDPDGPNRQLAAAKASSGPRNQERRSFTPALIIHGREDRIVPLDAAKDIALTFGNSSTLVVDGMGHTLSGALMGRIGDRMLAFLGENGF